MVYKNVDTVYTNMDLHKCRCAVMVYVPWVGGGLWGYVPWVGYRAFSYSIGQFLMNQFLRNSKWLPTKKKRYNLKFFRNKGAPQIKIMRPENFALQNLALQNINLQNLNPQNFEPETPFPQYLFSSSKIFFSSFRRRGNIR